MHMKERIRVLGEKLKLLKRVQAGKRGLSMRMGEKRKWGDDGGGENKDEHRKGVSCSVREGLEAEEATVREEQCPSTKQKPASGEGQEKEC